MAFPQTPLDLKVHAKINGSSWTDITGDVLYEQGIDITHGAGNEGARVDSSTCTFALLNPNGDYSPNNPNGVHYPNFDLGVPVRVSVTTGERALLITDRRNQHAAVNDTAALDIVGDIDVRIEMDINNLSMSNLNDSVELIGKADGGSQNSWWFLIDTGYPQFFWSADGSTLLSATSTQRIEASGSSTRVALRATLDVNNGAGGRTVRFYRSDSITGTWEQLGSDVTSAGVTSIFNSTAPLRIADATSWIYHSPLGRIFKASVRDGIGGTEVANPDFTAQSEGATSFSDAAGRTWNIFSGAEITNRKIRFLGDVTSLKPSRRQKNFRYVDVEARGIMHRLGANDAPLQSAMFREMTNPARTDIVAYWPMEDGNDATSFGSGYAGHPAATMDTGTIDKAAYALWAASSPVPTFGTARVNATVPAYDTGNEVSVRVFVAIPSTNLGGAKELFRIRTSGTAAIWTVQANAAGDLRMIVYDSSSTSILDTGNQAWGLNGKQRIVQVEMTQSGADINWILSVFDLNTATVTTILQTSTSGTLAGYTKGQVKSLQAGSSGDLLDTAIGHLTVADSLSAYSSTNGSLVNWAGEGTTSRMVRLANEEEFLLASSGMGVNLVGGQGETDVITLLQDAATADGGILAEARDFSGFLYRSPVSLSSQAPSLTLTYTAGTSGAIVEPFDPVTDNDETVNDYTARRRDGGFTRLETTTGARSTQAHPNGVGRYAGEDSYNLFYDADTNNAAGWALNLGSTEDPRVTDMTILLQKATGLIESACDTYVGDIVEVSGLPTAEFGTDKLRFMVRGYRESIDQFSWSLRYVLSPAGPWRSGFALNDSTSYAEDRWAWADTESSELAASLTSSATTTDILTNLGEAWTSEMGDTPYVLKSDGEFVRVQGPGALIDDNPFFHTNVTGWTVSGGSVAFSTAQIMTHPEAAGSALVTPPGGAAVQLRSSNTAAGSVNPGARHRAAMWVYSPSGWNGFRLLVNWRDSGGTLISTSTGTTNNIAAGVWTLITETFTADTSSSTSRCNVVAEQTGTPAAGDVWYAWGVRVARVFASTVYDEFGRTSTDTWGTADSKQTWTNSGGVAADYDVLTGFGRHINQAVSTGHHSTITAVGADFDITCDITTAALSTGASQFAGILARFADADNLYEARVEFTTANAIILSIRKRVATVETQLATFTTGFTHVAGTNMRVRFQGYGTSLKARIYAASTVPEPSRWHCEATDSAITAAGSWGVKSVRNAGNTNANAEFRFDNFRTITPQSFTLERSVNGVTKSHSAAADISLAYPSYAGR